MGKQKGGLAEYGVGCRVSPWMIFPVIRNTVPVIPPHLPYVSVAYDGRSEERCENRTIDTGRGGGGGGKWEE